jgi:Zn-finger nucleic acid-binding protein
MLASTDRQGIEIDFCPQCWGIWLDRGELNLLIEREADALKAIMSDVHGLGPQEPDAAAPVRPPEHPLDGEHHDDQGRQA